MNQDLNVVIAAAAAVTVVIGLMVLSVETASQVSQLWTPESFLRAERMGCFLPCENQGFGFSGCLGLATRIPSESLNLLPSPVTVADYISRAESQSRQRPPLERTKPSEDSLSGQKVGRQDVIYPSLFCCYSGAEGTTNFTKKSLTELQRQRCLVEFRLV